MKLKIIVLLTGLLTFSTHQAWALDTTADPLAAELLNDPIVNEQQFFTNLVQAIDMLYSMSHDYRTLSNKALANSLLITPDRVTKGYHIKNIFGGEVMVHGTTYAITDKDGKPMTPIAFRAFSITYTQVPQEACKAFFSNTIRYFQSIQVNDSPAFNYDGKMKDKEYMPIIESQCKEVNTMEFIRAKD